jgi:hypothetical protein
MVKMANAVKQLLDSLDSLTESEKQVAAVAILRRTTDLTTAEPPDEALVAAAEELFLELDDREAGDGRS